MYTTGDASFLYIEGARYKLRIPYATTASAHMGISDYLDTSVLHINCINCCRVGAVDYSISSDPNRRIAVLEESASRIVIQIKGTPCAFAGATAGTPLTGGGVLEVNLTCYNDRIIEDVRWTPATDQILAADASNTFYNVLGGCYVVDSSVGAITHSYRKLTDATELINNSGTSFLAVTSLDYQHLDANIFDVLTTIVYASPTTDLYCRGLYNNTLGANYIGFTKNGTTKTMVGGTTYRIVLSHNIECSIQSEPFVLNTAPGRLSVATQELDLAFTTLISGSIITGTNLPVSLGTAGLSADGAIHINGAPLIDPNEQVRFQWPGLINKNRQVILRDFPVCSGNPPQNHLLAHFKLDEATGSVIFSTDLLTEATWRNISDDSARDCTSDVIASINGNGLTTGNRVAYLDIPVANFAGLLRRGTVDLTVQANISFGDTTSHALFSVVAGNNLIAIWYDCQSTVQDESFIADVRWDNTVNSASTYRIASKANTANLTTSSHQLGNVKLHIRFMWDSDNQFTCLMINNNVVHRGNQADTNYVEAAITSIRVGSNSVVGGKFILDDIKIYNRCVLYRGGFPIGNPQVASRSNSRSDITMYNQLIGDVKLPTLIGQLTATASGGQHAATTMFNGTYYDTNNASSGKIAYAKSSTTHLFEKEGTLLVWMNPQTWTASTYVFDLRIGSKNITVMVTNSTTLTLTFGTGSTTLTHNMQLGKWYPIRLSWKGRRVALSVLTANAVCGDSIDLVAGTGSVNIAGSYNLTSNTFDCFVGPHYISNRFDAGEVATINGLPCLIPMVNNI